MTDAWRSIKIRDFEYVIATPSTSLLRVGGKPPRRGDGSQRPTLLADDGVTVHRFAPIPSPPDPRGVLRAAYSVPTEVIAPDTGFLLELGEGFVIALPAPTPGPGRPVREADSRRPADPDVAVPTGTDSAADAQAEPERRSEMIAKVGDLSAALAQAEQSGAEHEAARAAAEAELQEARERLSALEERVAELDGEARQAAELLSAAQAQAAGAQERAEAAITEAQEHAEVRIAEAQAGIDTRVGEAEQRAAARVAEAIDAADARVADVDSVIESRTAETNRRADGQALEAAAARDLSESLERHNVQLDKSLREQQERIQSLERDVATAVQARQQLQDEITSLRKARARSEQELEHARDAVRVMTFERDELSRQAAAFDGVAIKARERATQAEAANEQASETLEELQTWRAELERRMAATTTELGVAKAGRHEDELELKRLRGELAESEAKFELAHSQIESLNRELAAGGTPDDARDGPPGPAADESAELKRMTAELAVLRAAQATAGDPVNSEVRERIQMLESERDEIARRAEQLAALLPTAERLAELARDLSRARDEAESLQAAITVELRPSGGATGSAGAGERGPDVANGALAGARTEIQALREQLDEARAAAAEAQLELIGHVAEAEARQQAQRELAEAVGRGRPSGR